MSGNARELFFKEQKTAYAYSVASNGQCLPVSVRSESSVSALSFNPTTRTITFTVADSNGTTGHAAITLPAALAGKNFTASVNGQSVTSQSTSDANSTTVSLDYGGGIKTITLTATGTP